MSMSKLDTLNKSAELLDEYLDNISDAEFLAMHESVKCDVGPTFDEFFGSGSQFLGFTLNGVSQGEAEIVANNNIVWSNLEPTTENYSDSANDDAYMFTAEAA